MPCRCAVDVVEVAHAAVGTRYRCTDQRSTWMIRLLVVLAVLGLAYYFLAGGGAGENPPPRPEEQYKQAEQQVQGMEQQLQDQARQQLEKIDAVEQQAPDN